jgi:hypothetical protein
LVEIWLNGTKVGEIGANPQRDCTCASPSFFDVTALINSPGVNCVATVVHQLAEDIGGRRGGPAFCDSFGCSRNCCGYPTLTGLSCGMQVQAISAVRLELFV